MQPAQLYFFSYLPYRVFFLAASVVAALQRVLLSKLTS